MGSNCQKFQDQQTSKLVIDDADNNQLKKQQHHHHPSQILNYCFPQKIKMQSIKTKLQLELDRNTPIQPTDPGSPVEALQESESESIFSHQNSKHYYSYSSRKGFNFGLDEPYTSISYIKSIKNIEQKINTSKKHLSNSQHKGIIKNSLLNEFSKSPKSQRTVKSVRFLISASNIKIKGNSLHSKRIINKYNTSRKNEFSTLISNSDQIYQYNIIV